MKKTIFMATLAVSFAIFTSNVWAEPFSQDMSNDIYGIEQGGGNMTNISTPKDKNDGGPDINDAINQLLHTSYARNSDVDFLQHIGPDSSWNDIAPTGQLDPNAGPFVLISLTAANTNTLGVYDVANPTVHIPVLGPVSGFGFTGDGTIGNPYQAAYSPLPSGTNFGWYLDSARNGSTTTWDSLANRNSDSLDHMLTYNMSELAGQSVYIEVCDNTGCQVKLNTFNNPYLITWEDKPCVYDEHGVCTSLGDSDYDDMVFLVDTVQPTVPEPISMVLLGSGLVGLGFARRKKVA